MLITEDRLEKALRYLAETDDAIAEERGEMLRSEHMAEVAEALAYKSLEGSIEDRKRAAKTEKSVLEAWAVHFRAVVAYEKLRARRQREVLITELYRTMESSRRAGHMQ